MLMRRNETGQVTAFVVIFMVALIAVAGLVIDGGLALSAQRRAINEAQAAARAGAEVLDENAYRAGTNKLDHDGAVQAATDYLTAAGHVGGADINAEDDVVNVDVRFQQPLNILGVIGVGSITARGHGSARTAHGVVQEND